MDIEKVFKIFDSCETEEQLNTAITYANLFLKTTLRGREHIVNNILLVRLVERIIGFAQGRLNVDL